MRRGVAIETGGALPTTVAELRSHLRISGTSEDGVLNTYLGAAASQIEGPDACYIALMDQTWSVKYDTWHEKLILPGWPITELTELVYLDPDGDEVTLALADIEALFRVFEGDYWELIARPGAILPPLYWGVGSVKITYRLGKANAPDVDPALITALWLLAGHFYENREATVYGNIQEMPLGVATILNRFRRGFFGA